MGPTNIYYGHNVVWINFKGSYLWYIIEAKSPEEARIEVNMGAILLHFAISAHLEARIEVNIGSFIP